MAVAASAIDRVKLEIEGMTCASCAARIERRLNKLDGVEATVNYATEAATVAYDPGRIRVEELLRAVTDAGYEAALPDEASDAARDDRRLRDRLAVAGTLSLPPRSPCSGPFSSLAGSGSRSRWRHRWSCSAAGRSTAPLSSTCATAPTMDTLISLGTLAAWTWSTVVLAVVTGQVELGSVNLAGGSLPR